MKNRIIKKPKIKEAAYKGKYTVVRFKERIDGTEKVFECIPDNWFVGDEKEVCLWPPKTGRSFSLRALSGEMPDETWVPYGCEVISENHATYSEGFKVVREKIAQKYNTSSAEEEIRAAQFRRKHPGLVAQSHSFENVFQRHRQIVNEDVHHNGNGHHTTNESPEEILHLDVDTNVECMDNVNRSEQITTILHAETKSCSVRSRSRSIESLSNHLSSIQSFHQHNYKRASTDRSRSRSHQSRSSRKQASSDDRSSRSSSRSIQSQSTRVSSSKKNTSSDSGSGSNESSCNSHKSTTSSNRRQPIGKPGSKNCSKNSSQVSITLKPNDTISSYVSQANGKEKHLRNCSVDRDARKPHSKTAELSRRNSTKSSSCSSVSSNSSTSKSDRSRNRSRSSSRGRSRHRSGSCSRGRSRIGSHFHNYRDVTKTVNLTSKDLDTEISELAKATKKINDRLSAIENRLDRLEVTVTKTFILVGDITRGQHQRDEVNTDNANDEDFDVSSLPIRNTKKLTIFKKKLKNKEFRNFLINREKEFCGPSGRQTDTVVVTKYLQRFISLGMRKKMTLKEPGKTGITLYEDYNEVYLFLIDLIKAGYKARKKTILVDEAYQALRIVWGRTKQLEKEKQMKLANKEKKKTNKNSNEKKKK